MKIYCGSMLQEISLLYNSINNFRVTVSTGNTHDACKNIQVSTPIFIKQVLHLSFNNIQGFIIEIKIGRAEELFPLLQYLVSQGTRVRLGLVIECIHLRREENRLMDISNRCRCLAKIWHINPGWHLGAQGDCVFLFLNFLGISPTCRW